MTKTITKSASKQLMPASTIQTAYDLKMTPEAIARLKEISEAVEYAAEQSAIASKISVQDDETNAQAADVVVNLAKTSRVMEDLRKYYTDPLEKNKKQIIAVFKKLSADAAGQEERLRKELEAHWWKKENQRRADETKRIVDEQERQRKARALGRAAPAPIAAPPIEETARTTQAENGSVGISLFWGFDVNPGEGGLIPREFLCLDEKKVNAAIAAGARSIPGLTISERPRSAVR